MRLQRNARGVGFTEAVPHIDSHKGVCSTVQYSKNVSSLGCEFLLGSDVELHKVIVEVGSYCEYIGVIEACDSVIYGVINF